MSRYERELGNQVSDDNWNQVSDDNWNQVNSGYRESGILPETEKNGRLKSGIGGLSQYLILSFV
jgi:hypothetical protein